MSDFLIVGNGRSGTKWLANTLNRSTSHLVRHEGADPQRGSTPDYNREFPLERWRQYWTQPPERRQFYGECHGLLRRYFSPGRPGLEMAIPFRFVLLRKKLDIVKSWMSRHNRTANDVGWITFQICKIERFLLDLSRENGFMPITFEDLTGDANALDSLFRKVGLNLVATPAMRERKINATDPANRWPWSETDQAVYDHVRHKFGDKLGI